MNTIQWLFSHQEDIFAIVTAAKNMASDFPGLGGGFRTLSNNEMKSYSDALYAEIAEAIDALPSEEFDADHPTVVSLGLFGPRDPNAAPGRKFNGALLKELLPYIRDFLPLIIQLIGKPA